MNAPCSIRYELATSSAGEKPGSANDPGLRTPKENRDGAIPGTRRPPRPAFSLASLSMALTIYGSCRGWAHHFLRRGTHRARPQPLHCEGRTVTDPTPLRRWDQQPYKDAQISLNSSRGSAQEPTGRSPATGRAIGAGAPGGDPRRGPGVAALRLPQARGKRIARSIAPQRFISFIVSAFAGARWGRCAGRAPATIHTAAGIDSPSTIDPPPCACLPSTTGIALSLVRRAPCCRVVSVDASPP
jgi:hypothetical protein